MLVIDTPLGTNETATLEYELTFYDRAVQHVSSNSTGTPPSWLFL